MQIQIDFGRREINNMEVMEKWTQIKIGHFFFILVLFVNLTECALVSFFFLFHIRVANGFSVEK